ncbi:MAG: DNA-processing protein DprA [Candidatus Binatia bacterium]
MGVEDEETKAWLALALSSNGRPDQWLALARDCGGALETVHAADAELTAHGALPPAIAILRRIWPQRASRALDSCRRAGIRIAAYGSESYPASLAGLSDPPLVLFWRGAEPTISCTPAVAVVGSRRCSEYGERTAARIGREAAAARIVVVSGLARGIDAAAHRGALETGRTSAVLAGGLDRIYPGEHCSLAERVVASGGCLLSEQPPGVGPRPWLFPFRNRIITGLCVATVVVEAGMRSGSLASARHAVDQGRDVFAVPGPIDSPVSEGCNWLLTQGAAPFCRTSDLASVDALSKLVEKKARKSSKKLDLTMLQIGPEEQAVLAAIEAGSPTADDVTAVTALDGTRVLALLTALELDGLIRREAHGRFRTCPPGR